MSRNNSKVGSIIGLIFFLGFGLFILFGWGPFRIFSFLPFFPMIFIIVIIGIAGAASANSRRSSYCSPKSNIQYHYYPKEVPRSNPYVVNTSNSSTIQPINIEGDEFEKSVAHFCQFCGTKKDGNAIFCHNCGSKLQ